MRTAITIFLAASIACAVAATSSRAATIPAGTTIIVKTGDTISSNEAPGTRFSAVLAHGVTGFPSDAAFTGKVVTSKRMQSSKERLTVDLVEVTIGGKTQHIKTTGAVPLESYTSSHGTSYSPGHYQVAQGRKLSFRLEKPLTF